MSVADHVRDPPILGSALCVVGTYTVARQRRMANLFEVASKNPFNNPFFKKTEASPVSARQLKAASASKGYTSRNSIS